MIMLSFAGVSLSGQVIEEWTVSGGSLNALAYRYVRNPATDLGGGIGSIVYQLDGADYRYYHYNHKGDVGALTEEDTDICAWYEYDGNTACCLDEAELRLAGRRRDVWGALVTEWQASGVENEFRFSTKQWDEAPAGPADQGLIYFGARHYDPALSTWTQMDPAGTADGLNMYVYAGNSPIGQIDPFGLRQCTTKRLRTPWQVVSVVYGPEGCPASNTFGWYNANLGGGWVARHTGKHVGLGWPQNVVSVILIDGFQMDPLKSYTGTLTAYERYEFEERYDESCESCCRYWYRKQYKAEFTDFGAYKRHGGKERIDLEVTHYGGNTFTRGECAPKNADYSGVEDFPTADLDASNISEQASRWLLQQCR